MEVPNGWTVKEVGVENAEYGGASFQVTAPTAEAIKAGADAEGHIKVIAVAEGGSTVTALHPFEKTTGKAVPYKIVGRRAGDVAECYSDPAKAKELLGDREDIGILTKILDSAIRLPVQAHPDKAFSEKYFNSKYGKEECWIILATRPGAKIFFGFKEGTTKEDFIAAIEASENGGNEMEELLCSIDVKVGDVIYIPAKMVHAIGYGCLLLEVQEPTDFTIQPERWCGEYKLSDREMYLGLDREQALECFDMDKRYPAPLESQVISEGNGVLYESIINSDITTSFTVNMVTIDDGFFLLHNSPAIYVVIEGEGIISGDCYYRDVKKGDYFMIPHSAACRYTVSGKLKIVECFA